MLPLLMAVPRAALRLKVGMAEMTLPPSGPWPLLPALCAVAEAVFDELPIGRDMVAAVGLCLEKGIGGANAVEVGADSSAGSRGIGGLGVWRLGWDVQPSLLKIHRLNSLVVVANVGYCRSGRWQ